MPDEFRRINGQWTAFSQGQPIGSPGRADLIVLSQVQADRISAQDFVALRQQLVQAGALPPDDIALVNQALGQAQPQPTPAPVQPAPTDAAQILPPDSPLATRFRELFGIDPPPPVTSFGLPIPPIEYISAIQSQVAAAERLQPAQPGAPQVQTVDGTRILTQDGQVVRVLGPEQPADPTQFQTRSVDGFNILFQPQTGEVLSVQQTRPDQPVSLDTRIDQLLVEESNVPESVALAQALLDLRDRPSSAVRQQRALQLIRSPADPFVISAVASGLSPQQPLGPAQFQSLQRSPAVQNEIRRLLETPEQAAQRIASLAQAREAALRAGVPEEQLPPMPEPAAPRPETVAAPTGRAAVTPTPTPPFAATPAAQAAAGLERLAGLGITSRPGMAQVAGGALPISQATIPTTQPGVFGQALPALRGIPGAPLPAALAMGALGLGLQPDVRGRIAPPPTPSEALQARQRQTAAPLTISMAGPGQDIPLPPGITQLATPAPGQIVPFRPESFGMTSATSTIAPGTPVFAAEIGGRPRPVPVQLAPLFSGPGGVGGLGGTGVGIPTVGTLQRLPAAVQEEFGRITGELGLDPRDVERRILGVSPGGTRRPRTVRQPARIRR